MSALRYSHSRPKAALQQQMLMRKAGIAALTTLVYYFLLMFINFGFIILPKGIMLVELGLNFLYLLILFWAHEKISHFFSRPALQERSAWLRNLLEATVIMAATLLLSSFLILLPMLLLIPDMPIPTERVRTGMVVAMIISLFFYYFVERERHQKQLQQAFLHSEQMQKESFKAQLEALKNQVNPHFLFNSLNVLGTLIYKDQDLAVDYVRQLSEVHRAFLDHGHRQLISLREELKLIDAYSFLMKTRFGDHLRIRRNIPDVYLDRQLPPGALQTLLENAVKHNGFTAANPLLITIEGKNDEIRVRNTLQARLGEVPSTGIGLQNLKTRYHYLMRQTPRVKQTEKEFCVLLPLAEPA